jgi:hypothetical protein
MILQSDLALIGEEIFKNEWEHVGGIWFEHDPEFKYTIAVTGNREQIRAYFDDHRLLEYVTIVDVDISLSEIMQIFFCKKRIPSDSSIGYWGCWNCG